MEKSEPFETPTPTADCLPDAELLRLFTQEPEHAWDIFIRRYADFIFTQLRGMGFDYDQAMDRFVYVCEKLSAENYRRLKTVRYAGDRGELTPWLRRVIKNLSINWAWSAEGRLRLFKPITRLPPREQHIFELYFWNGLLPSEIYEQLRLEEKAKLDFSAVLDSLERIFSVLNQQDLWRLYSNLARRKGDVSLDEIQEETGRELVETRANPEQALAGRETAERLTQAMAALSAREELVVRFHYEEGLSVKEVAEVFHLDEREVKNALKSGLRRLRRQWK